MGYKYKNKINGLGGEGAKFLGVVMEGSDGELPKILGEGLFNRGKRLSVDLFCLFLTFFTANTEICHGSSL